MKTILLSILIFVSINSVAQTHFQQGTYLSLDDLKNNNPSDTCLFSIEKRSIFAIKMNGGNDYEINAPNRKRQKILNKKAFAYSDGDTLYINCRQYKAGNKYAKIVSSGRYLLFYAGPSPLDQKENRKQQIGVTVSSIMFGAIGGGLMAMSNDILRYCYALDTYNNELHLVTLDFLDDILSIDSEIYKKFITEKQIIEKVANQNPEQANKLLKNLIKKYIPIVEKLYP